MRRKGLSKRRFRPRRHSAGTYQPESTEDDRFEADLAEFKEFTASWIPAVISDDTPVWESGSIEAVARLNELLEKYPDHPHLLELKALYSHEILEEIRIFQEALASALRRGMATYSIRMGLASSLITGLVDYEAARAELDAAEAEVEQLGEAFEKEQYESLRSELETIREGMPCKCGHVLKALSKPRCPKCGEEW